MSIKLITTRKGLVQCLTHSNLTINESVDDDDDSISSFLESFL